MRVRNYSLVAVALCIACVFGIAGCPLNPINPITTTIAPTVVTMGQIHSAGISPENCNDWTSPSWKTPQQWWNSLRPTQPPRVVGQGVVGSDILFDVRPGGGCTKFRQELYRSG